MPFARRQSETIEDVIAVMDGIIEAAILHPNRLGYFASLYRAVTVVVKERCDAADLFDDNDRMRRLDIVFANRYFDAFFAEHDGGSCTGAWKAAFDNAPDRRMLILQHLLLGVNAHIALDLGIAAATIAREYDGLTQSLEDDFTRLNHLLGSMVDMVQQDIGELSPLIKYADRLTWRVDEAFVSFSINIARNKAWAFARSLVELPAADWNQAITARDAKVERFGRHVIGGRTVPFAPLVWIVNLRESKDVRRVVTTLSSETSQAMVRQRLAVSPAPRNPGVPTG